MKKRKLKPWVRFIIIVISIITISLLVTVLMDSVKTLLNWNKDNKEIKEIKKKVDDLVIDEIDTGFKIDWEKLSSINDDINSYLVVNGTKIKYPVVQSNNNSYYMTRDLNKKWNDAGSIFMDHENSFPELSRNTVLYGHARLDESMFGTIKDMFKNNWLKDLENHYLSFYTKDKEYIGEIFSIYRVKANDHYIKTNISDSEFLSFANGLKSKSIRNFGITFDESDKIITLSTCADAESIDRLVIHARLKEVTE